MTRRFSGGTGMSSNVSKSFGETVLSMLTPARARKVSTSLGVSVIRYRSICSLLIALALLSWRLTSASVIEGFSHLTSASASSGAILPAARNRRRTSIGRYLRVDNFNRRSRATRRPK
ncbi:ORF193 [Saltwater crocodilepox virus]|nr:ORF193 [Saltwater crocodilepox virus]QGT48986.1 ORF193 [Saltwater crocodilepox virus]QGT49200.1 ORF193 [Saltwater crocodilepox virus]